VLGPNDFAGTKVLVTAGGTREAIDPVRVVTNRSSGKQGYAIAAEAAARGATVVLVTTVERPVPPGMAEVVRVASAADMQQAVMSRAAASDVVVMAAAVADFRPKETADHKIKKGDGLSEIVLEPTHDFLVDLGRTKRAGQVIVGFAAETGDLRQRALGKLEAKRLDLIVGNDVSADAVGFEHDTNEVVLLRPGLADQHVPLTGKRQVAAAVLDAVADIRRS
jgi:phosphopantothenoylcysteine decarboxylase/phosphopantothenate--cysteine ligase